HPRRVLERIVDIAGAFAFLALAGRRLADVIVQSRLARERRRRLRPLDLELFRRLDGVPFLVGADAEEALVPDHARARNLFDRRFVDLHRHGAGDRGPDHPAVHHAGHLDVGAEIFLGEYFWRDVVARNRLADDRVGLRVLRLGLAGGVERIADLTVP